MKTNFARLSPFLQRRPIVVVLAGPNGAGKTTFFDANFAGTGLDFVNADDLSLSLETDPYAAAELADSIRRQLVRERASFIFETVFSDPVGDKIAFLKEAEESGYTVLLVFIGLSSPGLSEERVAIRVSQGGHDVPTDKIQQRYARTMANLRRALEGLQFVWVFDNSSLRTPYRLIAEMTEGNLRTYEPVPQWFRSLL